MSTRKEIGKIQKVKFGEGGYQGAMIGFSFTLGGKDWGVNDFWGTWNVERTEHCKWSEEERERGLGKSCMRISATMSRAKVTTLQELQNIPVEVTFENMTLKSWRILEEVL